MSDIAMSDGVVQSNQLDNVKMEMRYTSRFADRMVLYTIMRTKPYIDKNFATVYAANFGIEVTKDTINEFITVSQEAMRKSYYECVINRICNIYNRIIQYSEMTPLLVSENVRRLLQDLRTTMEHPYGYDDIRGRIQSLRNTLSLGEYRSDVAEGEAYWDYRLVHRNTKLAHICCKDQKELFEQFNPSKLKEIRGTLKVSSDQWIEFYAEAMEMFLMLYTGGVEFIKIMDGTYKAMMDLTAKPFGYNQGTFRYLCPFEVTKKMDKWSCIHPSTLLCTKPNMEYHFCCKDKGPRRHDTELLVTALLMYENICKAYKKAESEPGRSEDVPNTAFW